ncbi:MAG: hypothetical protein ACTHXA_09010 [Gulosibacter sp.]|uniref:hypothetical protein n=1 Tax=Gulosibacter sp. TaxID=2817531 RepID=UPI003F91B85D
MVEKQTPHILELRIHGINNTPPEKMLGVEKSEIVSVASDDLGGFWTYKDPPPADEEAQPISLKPARTRTDRNPKVRTEAYSWGNMVRTTGSLGPLWETVTSVVVQIGWLLTLPFSLCNAAYWTRRIVRKSDGEHEWLTGPGALTVRLFALGLTLLLTSALATVALDLVGTQCYQSGIKCAGLPEAFDGLRDQAVGRPLRLGVLSLAVIAVIVLLHLITRMTRVRYESGLRKWAEKFDPEKVSELVNSPENAAASQEPPLLASRGFWSSTRVGETAERAHLAASIALILGLLAWDATFAANPACHRLVALFSGDECRVEDMTTGSPFSWAMVIVATGVVALVTVLTMIPTARSTRCIHVGHVASWALLIAAGLAYLAYLSYLGVDALQRQANNAAPEESTVTVFLGLTVVPTALVALLLVGCLAALWWRNVRRDGWWGIFPLVAVFLLIMGCFAKREEIEFFGSIGTSAISITGGIFLGFYLVMVARCIWITRKQTRFTGWWGLGSSVALTLSMIAALLLTCLLVFGTRSLLNAGVQEQTEKPVCCTVPATASNATELNETGIGATGADGNAAAVAEKIPTELIVAPYVYELFGVALVVVFILLLMVLVVVALRQSWPKYRLLVTPTLEWPSGTTGSRRAYGIIRTPGEISADYPQKVERATDPIQRETQSARRFASFAQRGEPILGLLAVTAIVLVFFAVLVSFPMGSETPEIANEWWAVLVLTARNLALPLLVFASAGLVALVIANTASKDERPLGLLWDILCFLPRAGHPFAPPCYGERTIPELSVRVLDWLEANDLEDAESQDREHAASTRKIVLAAHSMGAVLATATIFAALSARRREDVKDRIGLLTFGIQLRPYFSRLFPDVLGPDVLGVPPTLAPQLLSVDPWHRQVLHEAGWGQQYGKRDTSGRYGPGLRELLQKSTSSAPAWVNLWRRTDYLGFPVYGFVTTNNEIDTGTTESDPRSYLWKVARHAEYQFTGQYRAGLDTVINRLEADSKATEPPGGNSGTASKQRRRRGFFGRIGEWVRRLLG